MKAIAIDYYGTLVDVGQPFLQIKNWIINKHGDSAHSSKKIYSAFFKEHVRLIYSRNFMLGQQLLMSSYIKACDKFGVEPYHEGFMDIIYGLFTSAKPFKGAVDTVRRLREEYPVLLLTNADNVILYKSIEMNGFEFDYIVSSEDQKCNKPNERIFREACKQLLMPPEQVLMVGDSLVEDIHGALAFGMKALWINAGGGPTRGISVPQITTIGDLCLKIPEIGL